MKRPALASLILKALVPLVFGSAAFAQANSAPDADPTGARLALSRFLALNASSELAGPEAQTLLEGELDGVERPTLGPLPEPDRIVMLSDTSAVARLPAQGEALPDGYLYLRSQEGVWSIHALRTLALTGVLHELRRRARALPSLSPDLEAQVRNADLVLSSDRRLRAWFGENRPALERLVAIASAHRGEADEHGLRIEAPEARAIVERLHLNRVSILPSGVVRVSIGGILDNEVGFMHAPDPETVPPIDPSDHIWVEPLGGGWYLFKTT